MNPNGWIHTVTIVCHTLVLMTIIVAATILSAHHQLDTGTITFLATLGGATGAGLVINGRKVPAPPGNIGSDPDNPPR